MFKNVKKIGIGLIVIIGALICFNVADSTSSGAAEMAAAPLLGVVALNGLFKSNPKMDKLYVTHDGMPFSKRQQAEGHLKSITAPGKAGEIKVYERKNYPFKEPEKDVPLNKRTNSELTEMCIEAGAKDEQLPSGITKAQLIELYESLTSDTGEGNSNEQED